MRRLAKFTAVIAGAIVLATASSVSPASAAPPMPKPAGPSLAYLRSVTAQYHDMANLPSTYGGPFQDRLNQTCIVDVNVPSAGAMGYHWVDGGAIFDNVLDPAHPEAYVYAPSNDGTLHLAALEYIVPKDAWDATHDSPPNLFGPQFPFDETGFPNRYGLPAFYSQHVWIWKNNPAGTTMMWNPDVHCPGA